MGCWEVRFSQTAVEDVREAAHYMQRQLGAPKAATAFLDQIEEKVSLLESLPESCPLVRDFELSRVGYRWCSVGSFLMFFTTNDSSHTVNIERILYGARDWKSLL